MASMRYHDKHLEFLGLPPAMLSLYPSHDVQVEGRNIDKCK